MKNDWRHIKLVAQLSDDVISALDQVEWQRTYDVGEPIIWEGDRSEAIYFVSKGAVEIYRNSLDGREHTLGIMLPGDSFNLVPALMDMGENVANARCIQQSELLLIKKDDFTSLIKRYPAFSSEVLKEVAARLAVMTKKTGELALHTVRQRLASFLIKEADKVKEGKNIFWTRDDMARQIGTVRDVVTRNLRIFEDKGLIKRDKGNIRLMGREGLENIASGHDTT